MRSLHPRDALDYVVSLELDRDPRLPESDTPGWNVRPQQPSTTTTWRMTSDVRMCRRYAVGGDAN